MIIFKVISADDPQWNYLVRQSYIYDFYHLSSYHKLDENGEAKLLCAFHENDFICIPLIIRKINNTNYFDATSVYGYVGPLSSRKPIDLPQELIISFQENISQYFISNNIICAFSRLHPLISNKKILEGLGEIECLGNTISIDLNLPAELQRRQYSRAYKHYFNKAETRKIEFSTDKNDENIEFFIDFYYKTMKRLNAYKSYYFSRNYFYDFIKATEFEVDLITAKYSGKKIAGAIFTRTSDIMQYHLSASDIDYNWLSPTKAIIDYARQIGNEHGINQLHLGGGFGADENNSLFFFKRGFSKNFTPFYIWKYIVNEKIYNELASNYNDNNFFPAYRQNEDIEDNSTSQKP